MSNIAMLSNIAIFCCYDNRMYQKSVHQTIHVCATYHIAQGSYNGPGIVGDVKQQMPGILNISHLRHSPNAT